MKRLRLLGYIHRIVAVADKHSFSNIIICSPIFCSCKKEKGLEFYFLSFFAMRGN